MDIALAASAPAASNSWRTPLRRAALSCVVRARCTPKDRGTSKA